MGMSIIRSPESPGFLFWFESQREEGPRVTYGCDAVKSVGDDKCTHVSNIIVMIYNMVD
jgi:hypothetical protein